MQHVTDTGLVQLAWTEQPSLDERMLFVARGCSRDYEVADFPNIGIGDGVYFINESKSDDVGLVS